MMRKIFVLIFLAFLLQAPPAWAEEDTAPVLADYSVSPSSLGYDGGTVTISVRVEDDQGIAAVEAFVHTYSDGTLPVTLTPTAVDASGAGTYEGTVQIPANYNEFQVTHIVEGSARDTVGHVTNGTIGNITVDGRSAWPPFDEYPVVGDPAVTPATVPVSGGPVTIAATATDDHAISQVVATINAETVLLDPVSLAYRYEGTWLVPANASPNDVTYEITIIAYDDIGQASYVTTTVTVSGAPQDPSVVGLSTKKLSFGTVKVGQQATRDLVISSVGPSPVIITIEPLSGPYGVVGGAPASYYIAPGESRTITLSFTPTSPRKQKQTLTIRREDGVTQSGLFVQVEGKGRR